MSSGNVLLDKIFGAEVVLCPSGKVVKEYDEEIMAERKKIEDQLIAQYGSVSVYGD